PIPRSLVNCSELEFLDLGNNNLNDSFPRWLGVLSSLQILVLRSNKFHGPVPNLRSTSFFTSLRVIDVSQNEFNGHLPNKFFQNLKGMKDIHEQPAGPYYIGELYYKDSMILTIKGLERTFEKILDIFTTIDFSSNQFEGQVPEVVGELKDLLVLNFSHNSLTGQIPSSLGNLLALESLDLSSNKIEGRIPMQLTNLIFLAVLNLSRNSLVGPIPRGYQFNTFTNDSYIGNLQLCGFPLSKECGESEGTEAPPSIFDEDDDNGRALTWKFAMMGYGCGLVLGLSMGYIVFTAGKPAWLVKIIQRAPNQKHDFGFTYGRPPVLVNYIPPHCYSQSFTKIVLEWKATCKGTQFDRIFGIWLGGVELLRSCTAEPTSNGIVWTVEKDITRSVKTEGKLLMCNNKVVGVSEESDFEGLNGKFLTSANRFISSTGWIKSSYGNITTHSIQEFSYSNSLQIGKDGNFQVVNQTIHFNDRVYAKMPFPYVHAEESFKHFPLHLYVDLSEEEKGTFLYVMNVTLGFNEKKYKNVGFKFFISSLQNMQNAQAVLAVKNHLIVNRLAGTRQVYEYHGSDFCYSRNISSSNSIIDYDETLLLTPKANLLVVVPFKGTISLVPTIHHPCLPPASLCSSFYPFYFSILSSAKPISTKPKPSSNQPFSPNHQPMTPSHQLAFLKSPNPSESQTPSPVPSLFCNMTLATLMVNLLSLQTTPFHLIALIRNFPRSSWSGMLHVKEGNLTGFLEFGCLEWSYSGAAQLSLELLGLSGVLNLNDNQLEGSMPQSLVNCSELEVLDLGNSNLKDSFPHLLGVLSSLQILVLRSNKFHGGTSFFTSLRIINLSQNEFNGPLPTTFFRNLKAKKNIHEEPTGPNYIGEFYYYDSMILTIKGLEINFEKILDIFTTIDFSGNQLEGPVPEVVGELKDLLVLNFSLNSLTGQIPSSLGNLLALQPLDLSSNMIEGSIPM
ncbi:Leucine-rich repeat - like 10, partial [Theobroma cacao]